MTDERMALGEHELEALNQKLNLIAELVDEGERPEVTFTVFVPDERKEGGETVTVTETVRRIDPVGRKIILARKKGLGGTYAEIDIDRVIRIDWKTAEEN